MKKITVWSCYNTKTKKWGHNHIEDGHVVGDISKPEGSTPTQKKNWSKSEWKYTNSYLNENNEIVNEDEFMEQRKLVDYQMVSYFSTEEFITLVNEWKDKGYDLHGSGYSHQGSHCQAMVLYENVDDTE